MSSKRKYLSFDESFVPINDNTAIRQKDIPKYISSLKNPAKNGNGGGGSTSRGVRRAPAAKLSTRTLKPPSAKGGVTKVRNMALNNNGGKLVISHCEPVGGVAFSALGALLYTKFAIIPSIFPYLNGIAANFGKYRWTKLRLYYVPSCPTTTEGEVAMGTVYDVQDAAAATFIQVATMNNGVSFPPWGGGPEVGPDSIAMEVDCSRFDKPRYSYVTVAVYNALTASDKNNYTPVSLAYATQGSTAAVTTAGRIWVSYTVELIDPIASGINA